MTPKEKAEELIEKMIEASGEGSERIGKACALLCVDEIINSRTDKGVECPIYYMGNYLGGGSIEGYWLEVKKEIEKC